jgi:hypothetical protein
MTGRAVNRQAGEWDEPDPIDAAELARCYAARQPTVEQLGAERTPDASHLARRAGQPGTALDEVSPKRSPAPCGSDRDCDRERIAPS